MTKDEALRLAWDALEDIGDEWGFTSERTVPKRKEAITAIKEALAHSEHIGFMDSKLNPIQRKPLTDEEILTYKHMIDWTAEWSYINFARAIEAAHGIKE
jgi:integrase